MQSVKVNLRKANGTVWKTVTLGKGGYLKLPSVSNATGYTFMGWSKTRQTGSSTCLLYTSIVTCFSISAFAMAKV